MSRDYSNGPVTEKSGTPDLQISNFFKKKTGPYYVFDFIEHYYGSNLKRFLEIVSIILLFIGRLIPKKLSWARKAYSFIVIGVPFLFYGPEFFMKLKRYISDVRSGDEAMYNKNYISCFKIIDVPVERLKFIDAYSYTANRLQSIGIAKFILSSPNTKSFKIKGYYSQEDLTKKNNVKDDIKGTTLVVLEVKGVPICVRLVIVEEKLYGNEVSFVDDFVFFWVDATLNSKELENLVLVEYVKSLDIKNNVLKVGYSVEPKPRKVIPEDIDQINISYYVKQIRKVIESGRKRGIGFVGVQGTGKSSAIRKIEECFEDTIILHIDPQAFSSVSSIENTFLLIRSLQPLLVVIEDFDSFNVMKKNERVGKLINEMDGLSGKINAVFLVTINDTSKVNPTIINRQERFDEIKEVKPPQSVEEAYKVLQTKFRQITEGRELFSIEEITKSRLDICIDGGFTQAALSSMIDKIFLEVEDIKVVTLEDFNKAMDVSIETLLETKEALKNCRFEGKDPLLDCEEDYPATECTEDEDYTTAGRAV